MPPPPLQHNFVVIVPVVMKFGTSMKFDLFYTTMVTKTLLRSPLLHKYDEITCILAEAWA